QHLPADQHAAIAAPLASAFASTFVWAVVLVLVALIPALAMALMGRRERAAVPARGRRRPGGARRDPARSRITARADRRELGYEGSERQIKFVLVARAVRNF